MGIWQALANIVATFDIRKARDATGNEITPAGTFSSGLVKYVNSMDVNSPDSMMNYSANLTNSNVLSLRDPTKRWLSSSVFVPPEWEEMDARNTDMMVAVFDTNDAHIGKGNGNVLRLNAAGIVSYMQYHAARCCLGVAIHYIAMKRFRGLRGTLEIV